MPDIFDKRKEEIKEFNSVLADLQFRKRDEKTTPIKVPDGLMVKCPSCQKTLLSEAYQDALYVCPNCGYHARLHAKERLKQVMDEGYEEIFSNLEEKHLDFPTYEEKLNKAKKLQKLMNQLSVSKVKLTASLA